MSKIVDFSNGKRGPVLKATGQKQRITIRIDEDVLDWFRRRVEGGGSYQTLMNRALRSYMEREDAAVEQQPKEVEAAVRRALREELAVGFFLETRVREGSSSETSYVIARSGSSTPGNANGAVSSVRSRPAAKKAARSRRAAKKAKK